jgi:hypothetical protein
MKLFKLASIALCLGAIFTSPAQASGGTGGGGGSGGGGGGGGGTPCDTTPVLPTTAPAPDIFMRESFGMGANNVRPTGGKGCNKPDFVHTSITGFWMEYPGNKNTAWLTAPESQQTWRFCAQSTDPYEQPSPLQPVLPAGDVMNGCVISDWFDPAQIAGEFPTAIIPLQKTAGAFQASIEGWPAPINGMYVALGLTDSTLTVNNLQTSAGVWLLLKNLTATNMVTYELRLNGVTGPLLASGEIFNETFNRIAVRYDPATGLAGASLNEVDLGSFPAGLAATPKFVGFEGVGIFDNFVVRSVQ